MEVAAACFGDRLSGGWSPMTLWIAMRGGDVYSLCPLLPEKWAPPPTLVPSLSVTIVAKVAALEGDAEADGEETSAAQAFHDAIKEKAELGQVAGDLVINFEEVLVLTPRGRYDVDMFTEFLRLRGKTYDYKINYNGISRLFLLPKDDQHDLFIVSCLP